MSYISRYRRPIIILVPVCFIILWIVHCSLRTSRVSSYDQNIARYQTKLFTYSFNNTDDLKTDLTKIETWLKRYNIPAANALQPGLSRTEIDQLLKPLSIDIPEELYILYGWHNGQRGVQDAELIPAFRFLPLEEAIDTYGALRKLSRKYSFLTWISQKRFGSNNAIDSAKHLPILMFNGDDFYMLLCGGPKSGNIISYPLESADYPEYAYPNISSFAHELAEYFQNKAYFIDDEGNFAIHSTVYLEIFEKHHPLLRSSEENNISIREERTQEKDGSEIVTNVFGSGVTEISTFDAQKRLVKQERYRNGKIIEDTTHFYDEKGRIEKRNRLTYMNMTEEVYEVTSNWKYDEDGMIRITDNFGDGGILNTIVSKTENGEWCVLEKKWTRTK